MHCTPTNIFNITCELTSGSVNSVSRPTGDRSLDNNFCPRQNFTKGYFQFKLKRSSMFYRVLVPLPFLPTGHILGVIFSGTSPGMQLYHLKVSEYNLSSHLLFTRQVPHRLIKLHSSLRVKVSNFVSKIEVEKVSSFLPTSTFPIHLFSSNKNSLYTVLVALTPMRDYCRILITE